MAERKSLADLGQAMGLASATAGATAAAAAPAKPKLDAQGRAYATGRRKDATSRVWVKRGKGKITINGKPIETYFRRSVLRMLVQQPLVTANAPPPSSTSTARSPAAASPARPALSAMASPGRSPISNRISARP